MNRSEYPKAWAFIQQLLDTKAIHISAVDNLSDESLQALEDGHIPERDYRLMLIARTEVQLREHRKRASNAA